MITERNNVFYCDCGFSFERGRSGAHDCGSGLRKKLAESGARCAALAVELESVKQQEPKAWFIRITDEVTVDAREGEKWRGVPLVRADVETPATDAFLAEVRAQGVEMFADSLKVVGGHEHPYSVVANDFAAQLRNEVKQCPHCGGTGTCSDRGCTATDQMIELYRNSKGVQS